MISVGALWRGVSFFIAVVAFCPQQAAAKPLAGETCKVLKAEHVALRKQGVKNSMKNGPEWAKANLTPSELDRIKRKAIPKDRLVDTLLLARRKHPGVSNRLDDLCSRYQIDNSRRTKHGALLDAELLAEVYIDLIGARQSQLILASEASDARAGSHSDAPRRQREIPLVARVSEVDREAHRAFVATLGDKPIWNDYLPPPAAAEAPAA